jgi:hypothetical protein
MALDGRAKPIDPGQHTLRFETAGAAPIEQTLQIHEGEKNRTITASFAAASPAPAAVGPAAVAPPAAAAPSADTSRDHKPSVAGFVVGGIGVAGLVVGAAVGGVVLSKKATADADCHAMGTSWVCSADGRAATDAGKALGPVSTVGFIVGGVGVAVGAVLLIVQGRGAPAPKPAAAVAMGPRIVPGGGAWQLRGSW